MGGQKLLMTFILERAKSIEGGSKMVQALRTTCTKGSKTVHVGVEMELTFCDEELRSHVDDFRLVKK